MELIIDIFLVLGAAGAGLYCFILSNKLKRFNDLEIGVGGAVAVLSTQVEELTLTLTSAQEATVHSEETLQQVTSRAEAVAKRLELTLASLHDLSPQPSSASRSVPDPVLEKSREEVFFSRHREAGER